MVYVTATSAVFRHIIGPIDYLICISSTTKAFFHSFNPYTVLHFIIMMRITKYPRSSLWRRSLATHTTTGPPTAVAAPPTRHDWTKEEVQRIFDTPLLDLVFRSATVHRQYHDPTKIQLCTLMNIKSEQYC